MDKRKPIKIKKKSRIFIKIKKKKSTTQTPNATNATKPIQAIRITPHLASSSILENVISSTGHSVDTMGPYINYVVKCEKNAVKKQESFRQKFILTKQLADINNISLDYARHFLQMSNYDMETAINLYYMHF